MTRTQLKTEEEMIEFGKAMTTHLPSVGEFPHAHLVTLSGELGSGKTTFTKGFAAALGVAETIQSPTFVIAKFYPAIHPWFTRFVHVDAYRLSGYQALEAIGWADFSSDPKTVILLEWPEMVGPILPPPAQSLQFRVLPEGIREVHKAP